MAPGIDGVDSTGAIEMAVSKIPAGYHTATPYLLVRGGAEALDYYRRAFGAVELFRMAGPDGRLGHAEFRVGDSPIMVADEHPEHGFVGPQTLGGSGVSLLLYVDDVDSAFTRALEAGGELLRPVKDQFYGDRSGTLRDPFGHVWTLATRIEDVPPEELEARARAAMSQSA